MNSTPVTCTACGGDIPRGDTYIADLRQREHIGFLGTIKVEATETASTYHPSCAPVAAREDVAQ